MAKQPYIPLYIGDWEQDTNCLSIEAEGAWLKIIFKCWKNKGTFSTTMDGLRRLLKSPNEEKFASILLELKTNSIGEFVHNQDGTVLIISRRLVREFEISEKRAFAGSKGGSKNKAKVLAKVKQTHEYEYGYDNEDGIEDKINGVENFALKFSDAFDEKTMEDFKMQFKNLDVQNELQIFELKCKAAIADYSSRDTSGLRLAFLYQLKNSHGNIKPARQLTKLDDL